MALPVNMSTVTLTGRYLDASGAPVRGSVTFTLALTLANASAATFIIPTAYTTVLDATGSFSVALPATNDPDVAPSGWTWEVAENFDDGRTFLISLPANLAPTVDLSTLAPALPSPAPTYSYVLTSAIGVATGVAPLDSNALVPLVHIDGITAAKIDSGAATNGFVLTADGTGGAAFVASTGGGESISPFMLMGA